MLFHVNKIFNDVVYNQHYCNKSQQGDGLFKKSLRFIDRHLVSRVLMLGLGILIAPIGFIAHLPIVVDRAAQMVIYRDLSKGKEALVFLSIDLILVIASLAGAILGVHSPKKIVKSLLKPFQNKDTENIENNCDFNEIKSPNYIAHRLMSPIRGIAKGATAIPELVINMALYPFDEETSLHGCIVTTFSIVEFPIFGFAGIIDKVSRNALDIMD